ncbi:TerD family protein [Spirillospora sp. NPDC127200]
MDVETSGLHAEFDRVLSVAVVVLSPGGEQVEEFSTLLDPGCDPGPVEVHGLTRERLQGSPTFDRVAGRVTELLKGRVLVAHNAQFDYAFLAAEFARAGLEPPVERRLCTLTLNRRLGPPVSDMQLGTLAKHYGVELLRAHDALHDARALAGILRASLMDASRYGMDLPLVACRPWQGSLRPTRVPKVRCAYRSPGRLVLGEPLVQGMKVAFTGETSVDRGELARRAVAAGLNVMSCVSKHTSLLVTNDRNSGTGKARRAIAEGVPVLGEATFLRLLDDVRPGVLHGQREAIEEKAPAGAAEVIVPEEPSGGPRTQKSRQQKERKPLSGRRVLVLGGTHPQASAARARIGELGAAAAVNLSASVTDVVLLAGAEKDRRMARITSLEVPTHDVAWLDDPAAEGADEGAAVVLPRGGVVDLPQAGRWTVTACWAQQAACGVDIVAFLLDEDEQVGGDGDFVFYGAPESAEGAVRLAADGPSEQGAVIDLTALPGAVRRVTVAAAVDGDGTFQDVGAIEISAGAGVGERPFVQATLDAATSERSLLLAEVYRRGASWRLRAVGQGYDFGLADLARHFGVDVED